MQPLVAYQRNSYIYFVLGRNFLLLSDAIMFSEPHPACEAGVFEKTIEFTMNSMYCMHRYVFYSPQILWDRFFPNFVKQFDKRKFSSNHK